MTYKEARTIEAFCNVVDVHVMFVGATRTSYEAKDFVGNDSLNVFLRATRVNSRNIEEVKSAELSDFKAAFAFAQYLALWREF